MKITLVLLLSLYCATSSAGDLDNIGREIGNAVRKGKDELEKSQIIKTGPRLFNHELTDENRPKPGQFWMAVVGDSSATGAAASPQFEAKWLSLLGNVADMIKNIKADDLGPIEPLPAPLRVMYTEAEFEEAGKKGQKQDLNIESNLSQKVDTEQYSFGYLVGLKMGVPADNIVLTGQDGKTVSSMSTQFERILQVGVGLPPLVLVSYVANDFCGKEIFENPVEKFRQTYEAELRKQFEKIAALPSNGQPTRVVILAPLDVANVLSNPQLLSQKIPFEGGEISCQQLRDGQISGADAAQFMSKTLAGACDGVLGPSDNPAQRLAQLRALQDAQAAALQTTIAEFNARNLPIKMEYAASVKNIPFEAGDLAHDCFHPGRVGADRIALHLLANELKPK